MLRNLRSTTHSKSLPLGWGIPPKSPRPTIFRSLRNTLRQPRSPLVPSKQSPPLKRTQSLTRPVMKPVLKATLDSIPIRRCTSPQGAVWSLEAQRKTALRRKELHQGTVKWPDPDLNRGHLHFQCSALPTELPGQPAVSGERVGSVEPQRVSCRADLSTVWGSVHYATRRSGPSGFARCVTFA